MHPVLEIYLNAGKSLKLPVVYREEYGGVELVLAKKKYIFFGGQTPFDDAASSDVAFNKFCTNYILEKAGFPVPEATYVSKEEFENPDWSMPALDFPLVAKPMVNKGGRGKAVFCNIQDKETLIAYLKTHLPKYEYISIEKFERGLTDYRVLVFFNKVIAVTRRDTAAIVGDGQHTIAELIALDNEKRAKNKTTDLGEIQVDQECEVKLKEMNLTLESIPKKDERIVLCYTCNIGRGGNTHSLGRAICKENAELLCRAARVLNLNVVGLDVICEDILIPIEKSRGFIIEANTNPDITLHEAPISGIKVAVAKIFLRRFIRRHPVAYVKNYLQQSLAPYRTVLRAVLALGLVLGLIRWLQSF